jgi:dTDP-4-dehydrorhamnose 3,5-epimerase
MNLVVPVGKIRFVIYDNREVSLTNGKFFSITIDSGNYQRMTVPPGVWVGFQGLGTDLNLLLNLANLEHDPNESENIPLESFDYDWGRL